MAPPKIGRKSSLTPEERYQRSLSAKRKFRAIVKLIIANLSWLQDLEDEKLGENVKKNIQVLTRKKGKKSLLTLADKAVLNKPAELRTDTEKTHLKRIIGNLKCFRRYPKEVKEELPGIVYFTYFGPGRVIVKQGHESLNLYIILSGEVVVSQTYFDKLLKEEVVKDVLLMGPGTYFGEVGLLHNIARTATVTTVEATEFLTIKRDDFIRVLRSTVAEQWAEIQLNMSWFTYFKTWSEIDIRESCILAKKTNFDPDQIVLSAYGGQLDSVYFITKGCCYLVEYLTIKTTYTNGVAHHTLIEDDESLTDRKATALIKEIKRLTRKPDSSVGIHSTLRPIVPSHADLCQDKPTVKVHFIKVCTFNKLACFNVGESLKNRIIISGGETECLLLPRYFLMDKSMLTFKDIAHFLTRRIPTPKQIFTNFIEEQKWTSYRSDLVSQILEKKAFTGNTVHNIPYSIRLSEDLGEL